MILVVHAGRSHYDVLIDRTTKWGNPFTHIKDRRTMARYQVATRAEAIHSYRLWLPTQDHLMASLDELRDKILGCWCRPLECHGDVLIEFANLPKET